MRTQPKDVHREVLKRDSTQFSDVPSWYAVWLGQPRAEGSVLLGRTERLPRARHWRVFPVTGEPPQVKRGWTDAITWLLVVRHGHEKVTEHVTSLEEENVVEGVDLSGCATLGGTDWEPDDAWPADGDF